MISCSIINYDKWEGRISSHKQFVGHDKNVLFRKARVEFQEIVLSLNGGEDCTEREIDCFFNEGRFESEVIDVFVSWMEHGSTNGELVVVPAESWLEFSPMDKVEED